MRSPLDSKCARASERARLRLSRSAGAIAALGAALLAFALARATDAASPAAAPDSLARDSAATAFDSLTARAPARLVAMRALVEGGAARGELVEATGIAVDAFGRAFVVDGALHRLLRYDARGARLGESGALGSDPGELRRPGGVALLGALAVAVLDVENQRVLAYDIDAHFQGTLIDFDAVARASNLGRIEPRAMASDRGGALFVVDVERDRLLVFDFAGVFTRVVGGYGGGPGSFRRLAAVAATRRGELVTVERSGRVQRLEPGGAPVAAFRLPGPPETGALAVAVDDSLRIAVSEEHAGRVTLWDRTGALLAALPGLDRPTALAFAPDGSLLIAESGPGRLTRFRIEPRPDAER